MKLVILIIISSIIYNNSYEIEYRNWHLTFDGQRMSELNDNGEIVKKVWIGNVHAYSKREIGTNIHEEYYRINDTLYQYQHHSTCICCASLCGIYYVHVLAYDCICTLA